MVNFDVVNLFLSILVDKSINIVRDLLKEDYSVTDRIDPPVSSVLELLILCINPVFFKVKE